MRVRSYKRKDYVQNVRRKIMIIEQLKKIVKSKLFLPTNNLDSFNVESLIVLYSSLGGVEKYAKEKQGEVKEYLMALALKKGKKNEKGHRVLFGSGGSFFTRLEKERRVFDENKLKELLEKKRIAQSTVFVTELKLTRLNKLVESGQINRGELEGIYTKEPYFAPYVKLNKEVKKELFSLLG